MSSVLVLLSVGGVIPLSYLSVFTSFVGGIQETTGQKSLLIFALWLLASGGLGESRVGILPPHPLGSEGT